jgi:hypothetical protein
MTETERIGIWSKTRVLPVTSRVTAQTRALQRQMGTRVAGSSPPADYRGNSGGEGGSSRKKKN